MTTLSDVAAFLLEDGPLPALIADRLHPVILPQRGRLFPAVTYQIVSANRFHTWTGPVLFARHRVQFDAWAETYAEVEAVSDALRLRMNGYRGPVGDGSMGAFFETQRDGYEPIPKLFRRSMDYFIWLSEEVMA
jgi:hypothetical protein